MSLCNKILPVCLAFGLVGFVNGDKPETPKADITNKKPILKVETGPFATRSIAAADMDGDGLIDILSTNALGDIFIYKNAGDGKYVRLEDPVLRVITGPFGTRAISAIDWDKDGLVDILSTDNDGNVYVHRNSGHYKFE